MTGNESLFVSTFRQMQADAYEINEAHGFHSDDNDLDNLEKFLRDEVNQDGGTQFLPLIESLRLAKNSQRIMLMVDELSEAHEGLRKGNLPDSHIPEFTALEAEIADEVIRNMNFATKNKLRLAEAVVAKQSYNRNRPFKHGGKKF